MNEKQKSTLVNQQNFHLKVFPIRNLIIKRKLPNKENGKNKIHFGKTTARQTTKKEYTKQHKYKIKSFSFCLVNRPFSFFFAAESALAKEKRKSETKWK